MSREYVGLFILTWRVRKTTFVLIIYKIIIERILWFYIQFSCIIHHNLHKNNFWISIWWLSAYFFLTDTRRTWRLCTSFIQQTSSELCGTFSNLWSGENTWDSPAQNQSVLGHVKVSSCFFFSHKFGKKLTYVNYLTELREYLNYEQLIVPPDVLRYSSLSSSIYSFYFHVQ